MSKVKHAALGTSGMVGFSLATFGLLAAQAKRVRQVIGPRRDAAPYHHGRFGPRRGTSIRVAMIGDSVAAGLGAPHAGETIGGLLAEALTQTTNRPVALSTCAVVGARSSDLDEQVSRALINRPHVAVIIIGANDVTHMVPIRRCATALEQAVARLRAEGVHVIVGTCPDLGTIRPVGPPLAWVARTLSRKLAAAQWDAVMRAGGRAVALGDRLGAEFAASPETLFASDQFHPSGEGYARIAGCVLPDVLDALGLVPDVRLPVISLRSAEKPVAL